MYVPLNGQLVVDSYFPIPVDMEINARTLKYGHGRIASIHLLAMLENYSTSSFSAKLWGLLGADALSFDNYHILDDSNLYG